MKLNGNSNLFEVYQKMSNPQVEVKNPLREGAFSMDDNLKIELISEKFKDIIEILGLDLSDDSLKDTPNRVAKMYVNEIFRGLNPKNKPKVTVFENTYGYHTPLMELNIPFTSFCASTANQKSHRSASFDPKRSQTRPTSNGHVEKSHPAANTLRRSRTQKETSFCIASKPQSKTDSHLIFKTQNSLIKMDFII